MPDLEQSTSQEAEMPPMPPMGGIDTSLPVIRAIGLAELPSEELTGSGMAEQKRRMFAFVLQTPETEHDPAHKDPELWMQGADLDGLTAFAREELDRIGRIPFTVLYVLKDIWSKVKESREKISSILGCVNPDKEYLNIPDEVAIDDEIWLRVYRKSLNMSDTAARRLIIERGRETARSVVTTRLAKEGSLNEDEIPALENMMQSITDVEFIRAVLPFAEKNPWVAINLLNNFALVDPKKRVRGLSREVDFTHVIENLLKESENDDEYGAEFAHGLAKILSNSHAGRIITQVKFSDVANRIMSDPVQHSNMAIALLDHTAFDIHHIANLTERTIAAYISDECDVKCRNILIEVSGYLSRFMNEFIEKAYKGMNVGYVCKEDLKNIISEKEFEQIKKARAISGNLNTVGNVNLCRSGIDEAYNAIRLLKERGSKTLLKRFYEQHMAPLEIIDEDAELPDDSVIQIKLHLGKALTAKSSLDPESGSRKKKPKRKPENQKNKKPRKALATKHKEEMARLAEKRKNGN